MVTDWKHRANSLFKTSKPEHFTDYRHCCECAEHDQTLLSSDPDSIGLAELGNAGWDPLCFTSPEGIKYYMPALVRLTLDTIDNPHVSYLDQFLFHLIKDGPGNVLVSACDKEQRQFIAQLLEYLIENHMSRISSEGFTGDDILRAHEIWSSND